jgi:hypothetical protein
MIEVMDKLMNSWYSKLNNVISVPVYKEGSVDQDYDGNYVELRAEGEVEADTKQSFRSDAIVIVDIVTRFKVATNRSVCEQIDNEIKQLVKPAPGRVGLTAQTGMQIQHLFPQTSNYFEENEAGSRYYRKIVRWSHRINQS